MICMLNYIVITDFYRLWGNVLPCTGLPLLVMGSFSGLMNLLYHFIQSITPCDTWPVFRTYGFVNLDDGMWHPKFFVVWEFYESRPPFLSRKIGFFSAVWHISPAISSVILYDVWHVCHFINLGRAVTCDWQIEWNGTVGHITFEAILDWHITFDWPVVLWGPVLRPVEDWLKTGPGPEKTGLAVLVFPIWKEKDCKRPQF